MRETARRRDAFDRYFALGPERTLERLHAELATAGRAPTLRTLWEWSRQLGWQHRLAAIEQQARVAGDAARVAAIREMQESHAREGLLLQQQGTAWLTALGGEAASIDAAIRAITDGAKLERLARGELPDAAAEPNPPDPRLEHLDDTELDRLLALARRPLAGAEPPPPP